MWQRRLMVMCYCMDVVVTQDYIRVLSQGLDMVMSGIKTLD